MKKINQSSGFTLVETLTAVLILVMVSSVVGVGVNTAIKAYNSLTFTSESDILASTVNMALSDLLRFSAYDEESSTDSGKVIFNNKDYYKVEYGELVSTDGAILLNKNATAATNDPTDYSSLINDGAYTSLNITDFTINYKDGVFFGSYKIQNKTGTMEKKEEFAFRSLKSTANPTAAAN